MCEGKFVVKLHCPKCTASARYSNSKLKCEFCGFEYYHNVASASVGILENDDRILLLERSKEPMKGKLHLPGGFLERNENAEAALKREIAEELSLTVTNSTYLFSEPNVYEYSGITYSVIDLYFKVEVESIDYLKIDKESRSYRWTKKCDISDDDIAFISVTNALRRLGYVQ